MTNLCNLVLLMTLSSFASAAAPIPETSAEQLLGLWGAERYFSKPLTGILRIRPNGKTLRATIADRNVVVRLTDNRVTLSLPGGDGHYRGHISEDRKRISGHWIQPAGIVENYEFATPLDLQATPNGGWQGQVRPFQEQLSVYLFINKEPDGAISVIMRNPERNIGLNYRLDHVGLDGDQVVFYDAQGAQALTGTLHFEEDGTTISGFSVPIWNGTTFDFSRRTRDRAAGFYPRPDLARYTYTPPYSNADGWPVAHAATVGVRAESLTSLVQGILDTNINSHRSPYIQDLVIARHGKLILEEHFFGFHGDIAHDSRSAGKSITSMAVGAAVTEGAVAVSEKVYEIYPNSDTAGDPRKAAMTVEHLLTMTSGYACDDNDENSPGNEGNMQYQGAQSDWQAFTLNLPMARAPGGAAKYCSGGINLLVGAIAHKTGQWYPEFFRHHLAMPLQIQTYHMNLDPLQRGYGGGGLRLQPRDFLKFGQTMLDGGMWQDRRILSEAWVRASLTPHSSINGPNDYGYGWWRTEHAAGSKRFVSWSATGNGGQLIIIVPEYALAIAFNGGNYNNFPTWIAWRDTLMPALIENAIN